MRFSPDSCPECGEKVVGTIERMMGVAVLQEDGAGGYEYEGTTKVWWDAQEIISNEEGQVLLTCHNSHEWYASRE